MDRTSLNAHTVMMNHIFNGQLAACVPIIDPDNGEPAILIAAGDIPSGATNSHTDSAVLAMIAIKSAHDYAVKLGLDAVY